MKTYQVTAIEQLLINNLFSGFVFRRTNNGKHWIKISRGQAKTISRFLPIIKLTTES